MRELLHGRWLIVVLMRVWLPISLAVATSVSVPCFSDAMLSYGDRVHEEGLGLYQDEVEAFLDGFAQAMGTTNHFHEYATDNRATGVMVEVDSGQVIDASEVLTYPKHKGWNRVHLASGLRGNLGEWGRWQWLIWTKGIEMARRSAPVITEAEHEVVYRKEGVYAAFPQLRRHPQSGQLYVSFSQKATRTHYKTMDSRPRRMTSRDSGRTWEGIESVPGGLIGPRPKETAIAEDGSLIRIGHNWRVWYPPEHRNEFQGKYRIETPGSYKPGWFAINSGGWVKRSDDGGKTWQKTAIPELDTYVSCSSPWSYTRLRDGRLVRAFMVRSGPDDSGDVFATFTHDGRTVETVHVMGDPDEKLRFTEETLVHETSKGLIWMLTRVEGGDDHLWQGVSHDGGRTWRARKTGVRGHPPSGLVALRDGRLVLTYGYRHQPYGIRAVISNDEGLTWDTDNVIVLRNDGASYDLGYPSSMELKDGTIVTVYYFTDDDNITHIASTRWRAPE